MAPGAADDVQVLHDFVEVFFDVLKELHLVENPARASLL